VKDTHTGSAAAADRREPPVATRRSWAEPGAFSLDREELSIGHFLFFFYFLFLFPMLFFSPFSFHLPVTFQIKFSFMGVDFEYAQSKNPE
jgi:hypothetical protein